MGYAALGHPEWIFDGTPSEREMLAVFAPAIDGLTETLPDEIRSPGSDAESQRRLARQVSHSVCNKCASELLISVNPDWEKRVAECLDDDDVDGQESARVATLHITSCLRFTRMKVSEWDKRLRLDRYD